MKRYHPRTTDHFRLEKQDLGVYELPFDRGVRLYQVGKHIHLKYQSFKDDTKHHELNGAEVLNFTTFHNSDKNLDLSLWKSFFLNFIPIYMKFDSKIVPM